MTVVSPSLTSTVVFARWVLTDGTPLKIGPTDPLSTEIFMITVLAGVICGSTFRINAASLKSVVTVLFDVVWYGTWTPCAISASTLFSVDDSRRGEEPAVARLLERGQRDIEIERAVDGAKRQSDGARGTRGRQVHGGGNAVWPLHAASRPPRLPLLGNARFVVLPSAGSTRPLKPHWMPSEREKFLFV